eukprot:5475-Heterococcus_DN1.PRE.2
MYDKSSTTAPSAALVSRHAGQYQGVSRCVVTVCGITDQQRLQQQQQQHSSSSSSSGSDSTIAAAAAAVLIVVAITITAVSAATWVQHCAHALAVRDVQRLYSSNSKIAVVASKVAALWSLEAHHAETATVRSAAQSVRA